MLGSIEAYAFGWQVEIPPGEGTLLDHPILLQIETRAQPAPEPPPPLGPKETRLAQSLLARCSKILGFVRHRITGFRQRDPKLCVEDLLPRIRINRDVIEEDGPLWWSFEVDRRNSPDHGFRFDFDDVDFLDAWVEDGSGKG